MAIKNFRDKVVVITGAGSGMGRAYAIEFGKLGSKLALNDFDSTGLNETNRFLEEIGINDALIEAFDVADKRAVYAFADTVKERFGNAHVVINNAGIEGSVEPAYHTDETDFHHVMNVNFYGVLYGTKAFLPQMVANGEGALVNVSSVFGLIGTPANADYCASKFAVTGFTEALMAEFQESPIGIHCLHPGGIDTNIVRKEAGKEFSKKYLTTPPEKIARHVISCIRKGQPKIVYGNDSLKVWLGSNLVPQRLLKWIVWAELKRVIDKSKHSRFKGQ